MSKILVLHWGRTAAGPALTLKLAQELIADGRHEVAVSYSGQADLVDEFRELPCPRYEVQTWSSARGVPRAFLSMPLVVRGLRRFMKEHGITTTLVPMEQPMQSLAAWSFRANGARYVHFMHDASLHPGEQSVVVAGLRRLHLKPVQEMVVFSSAVRDATIENWQKDPSRVHLTDLPPMFSAPEGQGDRTLSAGKDVVCGMFGRAVEYKGFDIAVDAVAALRAEGRRVQLRLVGKGVTEFVPEKYRDEPWLHLEDRWIADDEITGLIGSFDVLLLPYREASQSGVLVESAALGVPSVVTPVGGLPEQLKSLEAGEVADSVDPAAVALAIKKLVGDSAHYAHVAARARVKASGPQAWARLLEDLEPLL